jgi:NRPS condensation-like uncharacterized protein
VARNTWYRLDNIGKFYSAQASRSTQTVFRCVATLTDDIDETILQHALDQTVYAFPSFNVCLRSGWFWRYLEQSDRQPLVTPENLPICFGLHTDVKSILFRVSYYGARINLEVSHMVSDGHGTFSFFKTLVIKYIEERYGIDKAPGSYDGSDEQKTENAFDKYYERGKGAPTTAPKVFRIPGRKDPSDPTFMEYHLSVKKVLGMAHGCNVSLTSLVIAASICAARTEMPPRERNRAIRLDIPVDLRQFFASATIKNFFGLAYVSYVPGDADESLEDIARKVQLQITQATQPEALKARMNRMIGIEKNPVLRIAPLFAKDFALDFANRFETKRTTMTVSNLGVIRFPEAVTPYIRDIDVLTSTGGLSFVLASFEDDLSIGISTIHSNLDIVKNFVRIFSGYGIEGRINSNRTYERTLAERLAQPSDRKSNPGTDSGATR